VAEGRTIAQVAKEELGIPTLCIDVPFPSDVPPGQIATRIEAFLEVLRARRDAHRA